MPIALAGSQLPAAKMRKPGAKATERWEQILAASTALFREKGFAATSMQDVSEAVGLLKGSLYYYFKSKEDLLVSILHDLHRGGESIVAALDFNSEAPLDELKNYLKEICHYAGRHADRLVIFARDFQFVPVDQQRAIIGERAMYTRATERLIESAVSKGHVLASIHPRTAANAILSAAGGLQDWYKPGGTLTLDHVAEQTASILVHGLATLGHSDAGVSWSKKNRVK